MLQTWLSQSKMLVVGRGDDSKRGLHGFDGRLHQAQGAQPDHALLLVLPTQMKILPPARKSEAGSRQPRSICLFLSGMDEGLIIHVAHAAAVTARHRSFLLLLRNLGHQALGRQ